MQVAHVHTLAQDLDNVRRMREALGPDIDIMIDVNMGWTADVAIEMGRKFEDYDIYWLEEPVLADDFAGYQRIAAALDMRVVGGETHFTRYDLRPFFINPCLPILQPDPMRGGMTDLRKIATLADTWGITIAPHLFPELNVHLLASIPNGIWAENMGLLDDLWVDPLEIEGRHSSRRRSGREAGRGDARLCSGAKAGNPLAGGAGGARPGVGPRIPAIGGLAPLGRASQPHPDTRICRLAEAGRPRRAAFPDRKGRLKGPQQPPRLPALRSPLGRGKTGRGAARAP